jgi:serine/threonine protein kinase/tetratricopeptide (TPR) repeat protein
MATVFLAEDRKHDRQVAIKILAADAATGSAAERFQREIRLLARLQHPNILPVFDSGLADGHLWYAMPFVQGESLRARMERERVLEIGFAVSTLTTLADALSYAHESGVIHRDIKPENILLSHSIPLIADFGIAAALDTPVTRLTQAGMAIGTPAYMSPEQASADPAVDGRTDIYSLGCVGFEMLAGRPPFEGANVHAVIARMLSKTTPSIRAVRPEVSPALESAITRAIARDPDDRWQTGTDFSAALDQARTGSSSRSMRPFFGSRMSMRSKIGGMSVLIAAVAGAILLSAKSMRTSESRTVPATRHDSAVSAYRRGTARVSQRTQRTLVEGLALIDEAIRLDSGYAAAWAGRANAFLWARQWEFQVPGVSRDSLLAVALEASERALDIDSLDANAWLVSATLSGVIDPTRKDPQMRAVRRAISLDSLNARAWIQLGANYQDRGQMDSALVSFRRAMFLGKRAVGTPSYANHFYWRRQYDSAAVWSDSSIKYSPRLPYAWEMAGATAIMLKRYDDAERYYEAALRLDQGPTRVRGLEGLAEIAAIRGDTARALDLIAQAEKLTDASEPSDHAAIALGSAYAALGRRDKAFYWLEKYHPKANLHFQLHLQRDPQLDPLRSDPRFQRLISR